MTLTPEQIAEGWVEWNGGDCPIKDKRTRIEVLWSDGGIECGGKWSVQNLWDLDESRENIAAYRIIEAHGADTAPARPTPFPADYSELVWDADGMSQPFLTGGEWPLWLPMEAAWTPLAHGDAEYVGPLDYGGELAIRVRRREPKRETVKCYLHTVRDSVYVDSFKGTIDLIDGKPDDSTLKISEGEA